MGTNSANRNVVIITVVAVLLCLCVCVLLVAGLFTLKKVVVSAVPALGPVLSVAQQDTATAVPIVKPTTTQIPTRTPRPTSPTAPTQPLAPTETPAATEPGGTTQVPATEAGSPSQDTATTAPTSEQPTPTPQATSTLAPEIASSMDEIQQQVISIRGLQPSGTFTRAVLSPDQLRQKVLADFNKDYTSEDNRNSVIELSTLGLLAPGFDLGTFNTNLLSEQIAGYYDNKTKEMYVVGNQFGGMERLTYSHEYTHALQDQNYDIENGLKYNTQYCKQDSERCAGIQALIEGDATQIETDWLHQFATRQDIADIRNFYANYQSPVYDSAPEYMKEDLLFPYTYGQKFVEHLFNQGGWAAVDAAYVDVPVSTEQILHPERYPDDKPVVVPSIDLTATLGTGWQEVDHGVMGEWYTYLILAKGLDTSYRLDDSTAKTAAEGWGGDSYAAYYNAQDNTTVFALDYQWDTLKDADEFASALVKYGRLRFGQPVSSDAGQTTWSYSGGYVIFRQTGQATDWVLAPDQATAEAVWGVINP